MNPQFWWYLARASGIVAWLMLTATVSCGVVLATKAFPNKRRPAWLLDLHRWLGGLTLGFLGIHVVALLTDSYMTFGIADLTIPFWTDWKPVAMALGIIAGWLLVIIQVTSLAKRHMSTKVWRMIHMSSYPVFWLTTMHGALAGSDSSRVLYQVTAVASIVLLMWATIYRLVRPGRRRSPGTSRGVNRSDLGQAPSSPDHSPPGRDDPPCGSAVGRGQSQRPWTLTGRSTRHR